MSTDADKPPMDIARLYVEAQRSFSTFVESLTDEERRRPVPCTPGWTVRDVLSHVVGVADDITNGRVEGAATPPWTAAQIDRWRDVPWVGLIEQWREQAPGVGAAIASIDEARPPIDCHTHEHDVRHAVGRPGARDTELISFALHRFDEPADAPAGLSEFETFRSRLGRRSRAQVLRYRWPDDVSDDVLDEWFIFGPSPTDIVE